MVSIAPNSPRRIFPLVLALLLLCGPGVSMDTPWPTSAWAASARKPAKKHAAGVMTVKKAFEQLRQMKQGILSKQQNMEERYGIEASRSTLLEAFYHADVNRFGQGYSSDWGEKDIAPSWEYIKGFYTYHIQQLEQSAAALKGKHFASIKDLAYLHQGVEAFKQTEETIHSLFQQEVDLMAHKAKVLGDLDDVYRQKVDIDNQLSGVSDRRSKQAHRQLDPQIQTLNQERDRLLKASQDWGKQIDAVDQTLREIATHQLFSATSTTPRIPLPSKK